MPQEPKKRHSRARQGKRRASISLHVTDTKHRLNKYYALLEKERVESQTAKQKAEKTSDQDED